MKQALFEQVNYVILRSYSIRLDEHPHSFNAFIKLANQSGLTLADKRIVEVAYST